MHLKKYSSLQWVHRSGHKYFSFRNHQSQQYACGLAVLVENDKMKVIQISYSYGHNLRVQANCGLENLECKFEI